MNKLTKAAIATGAGIALLMGGAGTLAYWNDSASLTGGTITAGKLNIVDPVTAGTWATAAAPSTPINIATYKVVPGESLVYTTTVNVEVIGNALSARLDLSGGSIVAANTSTAADVALATALGSSATLAASGTGVTATGTAGQYSISSSASAVTVTATITFPKSATAGAENGTMTGAVNLSGLSVVLRQL